MSISLSEIPKCNLSFKNRIVSINNKEARKNKDTFFNIRTKFSHPMSFYT